MVTAVETIEASEPSVNKDKQGTQVTEKPAVAIKAAESTAEKRADTLPANRQPHNEGGEEGLTI
jgi:hypothetical protein